MEFKSENKLELKDKIINIYNLNKRKLYIAILILVLITISTITVKFKNDRENILVAEKYVQAGMLLNSNKNEVAKVLYEEIILSKNKFYGILSLNTIIEKELISDKTKIFKYFDILEKTISDKEKNDLIVLKKALYLIKNSENQRGHDLLKDLIDGNSQFKNFAKEILLK